MTISYKLKDPKKIFLTSDLHFDHKKIIKYEKRPFNSVENMNESLINNWNEVVGEDDDIFILGDFIFKDEDRFQELNKVLNGKKVFIKGNHDSFKSAKNFPDIVHLKVGSKFFVLCHYPMISWNKAFHGSYMLHGHVHKYTEDAKMLKNININKLFNVCTDVHDYYPVSLETVINNFRELK